MPQQFFKQYFTDHSFFVHENTLYAQTDQLSDVFEEQYIKLRQKEGRLFSDDVVLTLPEIDPSHPLAKEWRIRKLSADRLVQYLRNKKYFRTILEIGCGNGWLTNYLCNHLSVECCGIDVNKTELRQASRLFGNRKNITFICADILSEAFNDPIADCIVLGSAVQYFADLPGLVFKLLTILNVGGEIHILDTPFYGEHEVRRAKQRSDRYFTDSGYPEMKKHYYHHSWESLQPFHHQKLYDPFALLSRLKRIVTEDSPFPWIVIKAYSVPSQGK